MADHHPSKINFVRANSANLFEPPKMDEYVLTERIGQGTYATVYKAYKKGNSRDVVAIKCIKKNSLSKKSTDNLVQEIEILKSLDHKHIVKLKDFQWDKDNIFLILEYCSGGDLSSYIKRYKQLPEHVSRKFLRQLALALQYIRNRNISHMDLKPQNLFIESQHNLSLKVGDFGFAQYLLGQEGRDNLRGSPLYMAVEMFSSNTYDASVDLWSTGVILFETIYGHAPFASKTFEELEIRILSNDPVTLPSYPVVSQPCKDLMLKLLQRDPKKRISFYDFFNHSFVDLLHTPCVESLPKAIEIVTQAVLADQSNDFASAIKLYCSALEYFLPAIEFEEEHERKAAIRIKVQQYVKRAEQLKLSLKEQQTRKYITKQNSQEGDLSKTVPEISKVIEHERIAIAYGENKDYDNCLNEYYKGIDICMDLLSKTTLQGQIRQAIRSKTESLMSSAEEADQYRDLKSKEAHLHENNMCCVQ